MRKYIVFIILITSISLSVVKAQNRAIRLGTLTKLSEDQPNLNFYIGYDWGAEEDYFNKLNLFSGYIFSTTDTHESRRYENGLEYAINKNLIKEGSVQIYGGGIGRVEFETHREETRISTSFDRRSWELGLALGGNIGLNWRVKNDYFINAETSIYVLQLSVNELRVSNPAIPVELQTMGGFNLNIGINTMLKVSIGKYF